MKILYITHNQHAKDGWGRYTTNLVNEVKGLGHETRVLEHGYPLSRDPMLDLLNPIKSYFDAKKVNAVIIDFNPDIIHILVEPYATMVPFLKKICPSNTAL